MRVAVAAQGPDLNSAVDLYFGRARYFVVVDTESGAFCVYDNSRNTRAAHGAGTRTARAVVDLAVDAVIAGNVGHKAFGAIATKNIAVYRKGSGTVRQAVEELTVGRLEAVSRPNVPGHWRKVSFEKERT